MRDSDLMYGSILRPTLWKGFDYTMRRCMGTGCEINCSLIDRLQLILIDLFVTLLLVN